MFQILVGRQQRVEVSSRQLKQLTVPFATPTHCRYGANVVIGQQPDERPW